MTQCYLKITEHKKQQIQKIYTNEYCWSILPNNNLREITNKDKIEKKVLMDKIYNEM